ncbi:MAG: branched-chain amino acid ABC transporter permease [Ndongobacter sp.]|nr:branched-chain amino acid ABC transporter permease [Ndongobacter sp.]
MEFLLQVINGLQTGSIYALVALGYTMVYGVAKLINFAHGDIIMIGAYLCLLIGPVLGAAGLPLWLGVFIAVPVCALLGIAIERIAYRPLRRSPRISNLISAIGVSLLLENAAMKVFGTSAKPFSKALDLGEVILGDFRISLSSAVTILVTLILTWALYHFMKHTNAGRAILATSEDAGAAQLVGINIDRSISLTFALGSGLAAIGSLLYLVRYPQITPMMGSMLGIKAFIAAVLGGIGSIPGAVLGGFILGLVEAMTKAYLASELADAFVFGILIVVLLVRPAGIFGSSRVEKV